MVVLERLIRNQTSSNNEADEVDEEAEEMKVECKSELTTMDHLIECLKSSANIVSSTSTVVGRKVGVTETTTTSTMVGSDFGDVFPYIASSSTLDWIQNHNVDATTDPSSLNAHSERHMPTVDEEEVDSLDSDEDDVEHELIGTILELGIEKLEERDLEQAENYLTDCYKRILALISSASQAETLRSLRKTALENLIELYQAKHEWSNASFYLKEKLIFSVKGDKVENAKDTLALGQTLQNNAEHSEALVYTKKAYKAFKNMGPAQQPECEQALRLLSEICISEKNTTDANAFLAILNKLVRLRTPKQGTPVRSEEARPIPPSLNPIRIEIMSEPAIKPESIQSDDIEEHEAPVKTGTEDLGPSSETTSVRSETASPDLLGGFINSPSICPSSHYSDDFVENHSDVKKLLHTEEATESEKQVSAVEKKALGRGSSFLGRVNMPLEDTIQFANRWFRLSVCGFAHNQLSH
jgi:hypothetical protein